MIRTFCSAVSSWFAYFASFIRDALRFGYRLLTNKVGLPRWLWLAMLVSWTVIAGVYLVTGK